MLGGIEALLYGVQIEPRLIIDMQQASLRLEALRDVVEQPAVNAGVRLVDGQALAVPPVQGRVLDIPATLERLQIDAAGELADGALDLVMIPVAPAVTDATPLVQQASALLSSPLMIDAYDPINDQSAMWSLTPQEWSQWLVASPDTLNPLGLSLALDEHGLRGYLEAQATLLPGGTSIDVEDTIQRVNTALAAHQLSIWTRVYHALTLYTVQSGDTFSSIGYQLGIPYPWIQAANPGVTSLNPGQQITIPRGMTWYLCLWCAINASS
ncbi:MAG: LysM peptidoglycan-binding domain-containing protein [Anaerolineae bacterium]|nr:LysM peptidoglycan-binding domain-containing protein [Anaerolineae bacterium]